MGSCTATEFKLDQFERRIETITEQFSDRGSEHRGWRYGSTKFKDQVLMRQMVWAEREVEQCQALPAKVFESSNLKAREVREGFNQSV